MANIASSSTSRLPGASTVATVILLQEKQALWRPQGQDRHVFVVPEALSLFPL